MMRETLNPLPENWGQTLIWWFPKSWGIPKSSILVEINHPLTGSNPISLDKPIADPSFSFLRIALGNDLKSTCACANHMLNTSLSCTQWDTTCSKGLVHVSYTLWFSKMSPFQNMLSMKIQPVFWMISPVVFSVWSSPFRHSPFRPGLDTSSNRPPESHRTNSMVAWRVASGWCQTSAEGTGQRPTWIKSRLKIVSWC